MTDSPSDSFPPSQIPSVFAQDKIWHVSELNRFVRELLEHTVPLCWVSGEVSNLTRAASGHWYFTLKDEKAQVRCVMFKHKAVYVDWHPREGDRVEARVLVSLYEARGDFQLTVEFLRRSGLGSLFEAFEALKLKLQSEGLFDPALKRSLPPVPRQVGIITSPDAAALRDVLTTFQRRMPSIPIVLYPTAVQGKQAALQIAQAIERANTRNECDVLIVARGGGSLEDLWAFNEEVVARAIAGSAIPVISGVGHETDFTIADFVADVRAPTPTAAAEMASPNQMAIKQQLTQLHRQLKAKIQGYLNQRMQQLDYLAKRLQSPDQRLAHQKERINQIGHRLQRQMNQLLLQQQRQLVQLSQSLVHLNPLEVLGRGYALVYTSNDENDSKTAQTLERDLVRSSTQVHLGQKVRIQWSDGEQSAIIAPSPNHPDHRQPAQKKLF